MATGFEDWADWGVGGDWTDPFERPATLPGIEAYRTPEEDWERLTSQAQPFWSTRAPLEDIGRRLQARYLLAAPRMAEQPGVTPSFGQFLQDYPGGAQYGAAKTGLWRYPTDAHAAFYGPSELAELRFRAGEAAQAAAMAPAAYMGGATPETEEFRRRAWLSQQFGPDAERAAENQMRVANLLALQRGGITTEGGVPQAGGQHQGQMATAIRNAMANLYQQRLNLGAPRENFLNWYLSQTDPVRKAAGTEAQLDQAEQALRGVGIE